MTCPESCKPILTQLFLNHYDDDMDRDVERRAQVHAALGEPVRLAIVDELAVSDRAPTELAALFALSTSLLAHHLGVLEHAGLIERFESAGDRRRRYVRLRSTAIDALHADRARRPGRMVFVCSRNSARSQLAAALWTARTGQSASSAGTRPANRVHPGAVAAARRAGLDISDASPQKLERSDEEAQIVTVCDRAHEELAPIPMSWHWSIPDPVEIGTDAAFDAAVGALDERIATLTRREDSHG